MLRDKFPICQKCCPLNPVYNAIVPPHKYGFDRKKE